MKIGNTIYLDYQATTPVDPRVLQVMAPFHAEMFGNPHSADHVMGWSASRAIDEAAAAVADLIGADRDEIVFTSGATEANNLAMIGTARRASGGKRRRILVSAIEHKCVLASAAAVADQLDYKIEIIPVDEEGFVKFDEFKKMLNEDVHLVSIVAVNNEIGTIQNLTNLSQATMAVGALFHCDASQAAVGLDLAGFSSSVDLLSLSAHKMYGPKGIGALYVHRDLACRIEPLIHGGGQQKSLRSGTVPTSLCAGMGTAATILASKAARNERVELGIRRDRFVEGIMELGRRVHLNGPKRDRHPGNANVRFEGFYAHDVLGSLQPRLAASTGSACTTGMPETSHVLRAIGLSEQDAEGAIRFSLGRFTTDQHVDEAVELIGQVLERLSNSGIGQTG